MVALFNKKADRDFALSALNWYFFFFIFFDYINGKVFASMRPSSSLEQEAA